MNRLPAIRTLATALLGTLLAVGGIAPASAQQRGGDDDSDDLRATPQQCNDAQAAAVCAGIGFALAGG